MRTLERNKSPLWVVDYVGEVDVLDEDGFFTGELEPQYTVPRKINIGLYPANGQVLHETFGKDVNVDMLAVSENIVLSKDTLLFSNPNISNYDNYDYKVTNISKSLNYYQYGLKGRF